MDKYFDKPTQVMFADPDNEGKWLAGIAYKNEIICACCGGVYEIEDILEFAKESDKVIFPYDSWYDISDSVGDVYLPRGLEIIKGKLTIVEK